MDSSQFKTALYVHCHWHAVVCFTTAHYSSSSEARRACMTVKQQDDCVTDSSDYKPRSSFTLLGLFSGIINLNMTVHIFIMIRTKFA